MVSSPGEVLDLQGHADFDLAVPTPDHFLPLLYLAKRAEADGATPEVLIDGNAYGSISMTAYTLGADGNVTGGSPHQPRGMPDPDLVPADDTNI